MEPYDLLVWFVSLKESERNSRRYFLRALCALNFPIGMNPGLAKALGVMMNLDFQRAVLNRIPEIEAHPNVTSDRSFFSVMNIITSRRLAKASQLAMKKFFSLSRQPKCIPIVATQSLGSLKSILPGETWRTLLQTFRVKVAVLVRSGTTREILQRIASSDRVASAAFEE